MLQKKIILFILLICFNCKENSKDEVLFQKFDTSKFDGNKWKILPSNNEFISFEKDKTYHMKENQKVLLHVLEDSRGLRFQYNEHDSTPLGYFLFIEKSKNSWGGVFEDKIVRLELVTSPRESILE